MSKALKRSVLALAVTASLGIAQGAHANALAVSDILLNNLVFRSATTGAILDNSDFSALVFTNSAQVTASIGPLVSTQSNSGTPLDLYACVGVGCPANNAFPFLTPPPTSLFATADQLESGSPISGLTTIDPITHLPVPIPVGATVDAATYASVNTTANPIASSNNGLSSTFMFKLAAATAVTIQFDARAYLDAFTALGESFPTFALAGYTTCFTITPVGVVGAIVNWCPDGTPNNDLGMTATTEPFNLNASVSRNAPFNGNSTTGNQSGFFSGTTITLLAGVPYQLSAIETSQASALEVPEPGTLALLGISLLGFGFARRKIAKKQ